MVGQGHAPHPLGTEADPEEWWSALQKAGDGLLERAAAVGVAGEQHGMVALDDDGEVIRPALLWNDLRSAGAAAELVAEFGGPGWWAANTGSVPAASFTVTKLRWLAEHEPANAARVSAGPLPHDWLTSRLLGGMGRLGVGVEPVTDRGDASGTGYFSPAAGTWLPDLAAAALGHAVTLPRVAAPGEVVGQTGWDAAVSAGTGDNMGAALGLGLRTGDVAVSIGTSGTAFAVSEVRRTIRRARWPGSPMPRGGSCRWCARSTRASCCPLPRRCSAPTSPGSPHWRWPASPARAGSPCCPTWTASGPRTGRTPPGCFAG